MKIFIAGGTGFAGGHLKHELLSRGHELRLLVHRRGKDGEQGVEQAEGDVTRPESFVRFLNGCDAVINLVGIIREFPSKGMTFERLHVQATANMLAAAQKSGIRRYLQMSALGTRPNAVSGYHKTKFRAEELVRASGLDWTIMRPSLIFGPQDAFVNMLAAQIRMAPVMPVIGDGNYRLQPIHGDDVARCFALALEMPGTIGQTYELCGNDRMSYLDLLDTIADAMGKFRPLKPRIPLGLMKLAIPVMQNLPQFPITMDQLQMLIEENICDGRWKETFRFEPRNFKEGIREYLGASHERLAAGVMPQVLDRSSSIMYNTVSGVNMDFRFIGIIAVNVACAMLLITTSAIADTIEPASEMLLSELSVGSATPLEELVIKSSPREPRDGFASYYASRFIGRRTTSGHRYNPEKMTAAHHSLPLGTVVRVVNPATKQEVHVTITDRCAKKAFHFIDLSRAAAKKIGLWGRGKIKVVIIPLLEEALEEPA
jgi:uncharacterized protein YbjT (DUF2867 family)